MAKFIFFKNTFFNVRHINRVDVIDDYVSIYTTDGKNFVFQHDIDYDEAEKKQFLEDIESMM
jgi:hypothetical protein